MLEPLGGSSWQTGGVVSSHTTRKNGESEPSTDLLWFPSRCVFPVSLVFLFLSNHHEQTSGIKTLLAATASVFNLENSCLPILTPPWPDRSAEAVPAVWARQRSGSGSVYSSADGKYGTATLSQFHPCKPENLLRRRDRVQQQHCWQEPRLPFLLACVALLDTLPGWGLKPVESWPGRKSCNPPWLLVPQQRCFVVWEHGCSTGVSWRCWRWVIVWTTQLITVDNLKMRRRAVFIWSGFDVAEQLIGCFYFLQLWSVCFMATGLLTRGVRGRIIGGIIISTSVGLNPDLWSAKVAHLSGSRGPQEFKDRGLERMVHLSYTHSFSLSDCTHFFSSVFSVFSLPLVQETAGVEVYVSVFQQWLWS